MEMSGYYKKRRNRERSLQQRGQGRLPGPDDRGADRDAGRIRNAQAAVQPQLRRRISDDGARTVGLLRVRVHYVLRLRRSG